jgi:excisionase family DNA binding protein
VTVRKGNIKVLSFADAHRVAAPQPTVGRRLEARESLMPGDSSDADRKGSAGTLDARDFLKSRLALAVPEVAKLLGISPAAIRLMIHRGELPGKKVGGGTERVTYIIPTGSLLSWLDGAARPAPEESAA